MRILVLIAILLAGGVSAQDLFPTVPQARFDLSTPHPDDIRINHIDYLRHDRDATMRLGDRDIEFSLKDCVDCHAVRGPDAGFVTVESEQHFCRACHEYAAVQIDCFQCHNSLPEVDLDQAGLISDDEMAALSAYLEGLN
ncbi:MAG: hypothetical protein JKY31_00170 [Rhodobacteraceae bacterium]|nr:hypothetical protein [Paracoccaceae bacterium]